MGKVAIIDNNVVTNVIVGSVGDFPGSVDVTSTECGVGWTYDGVSFSPPVAQSIRTIPRQEFIDRFTFEELTSIKALATGNDTSSSTQDAIEAAVFWDQVMARNTINLDSTLAQGAKLALQGWGILTSTRADEVFA